MFQNWKDSHVSPLHYHQHDFIHSHETHLNSIVLLLKWIQYSQMDSDAFVSLDILYELVLKVGQSGRNKNLAELTFRTVPTMTQANEAFHSNKDRNMAE